LQLIFRNKEASQLSINEIGEVNIKLSSYTSTLTMTTNQMVLILIDAANTTAGAGFIR
jgi:sulfate adenylyltransferase subunit 1